MACMLIKDIYLFLLLTPSGEEKSNLICVISILFFSLSLTSVSPLELLDTYNTRGRGRAVDGIL